jgi:recombination protein RecT
MANEVAKRAAGPIDVVRSHIESPAFLDQLKLAMPRGEDGRRLARGAITAMQKTPAIAECSHPSIFAALLTCAQLGLSLDGREAHLVPFKGQCTLIPDYKGLVRLVIQSGSVSHVHADVVCENDDFDFDRGKVLRHKIDLRRPRGPVYAAYAFAVFSAGTEKAEVMSLEEINAIRTRGNGRPGGPWNTDYNEMAKKTVFKRLCKWLPLAPEAQAAIEEDDSHFEAGTTTVSAPPAEKPRPRNFSPSPQEGAGQTEVDPGPAENGGEGSGEAAPPAVAPSAPPQPPPAVKPGPRRRAASPAAAATVNVPAQAAATVMPLLGWMNGHKILLTEVAQALVEYGCSPEGRQSEIASLADVTEAEAKFILDQGDAIAAAIIGSRAG